MKWSNATLHARLNLSAAVILFGGLGSAVWIYLTAVTASDSALVSDYLNSKKYIHELKAYGGNATVLADEFCRWFDGLWHGEALAYTVACITVGISFGLFFVAYHLQSNARSDSRSDDNRGETI